MNLNVQDGYVLDTLVLNDYVHHYGIICIENNEILVIHNTINDNVIVDTFYEFLINRKLVGIYKNKVDFNKIQELKDMKYDLFNFNCMQFVEMVSI